MSDECRAPFHKWDFAPRIEYTIDWGPGLWSSTGYECPRCGFRTVSLVDSLGGDVSQISSRRLLGWSLSALIRELWVWVAWRIQATIPPRCRECGERGRLAAWNEKFGFQRDGLCSRCLRDCLDGVGDGS